MDEPGTERNCRKDKQRTDPWRPQDCYEGQRYLCRRICTEYCHSRDGKHNGRRCDRFAMANPPPEIMPDEARKGGARVIATGRSDFPNQINNVLVFPGVFRGAFDVRASDINEEMKIAAAKAIADLISDEELFEDNIIPKAFDKRVGPAVAKAVAEAARKTGIARI